MGARTPAAEALLFVRARDTGCQNPVFPRSDPRGEIPAHLPNLTPGRAEVRRAFHEGLDNTDWLNLFTINYQKTFFLGLKIIR